MVTKGYIQEVLSPNKVSVRVPLLHKIEDVNGSVPNDLLPTASISLPPHISLDPSVGDVVIVSFEEDDLGSPVILGFLSTERANNTSINVECEDLTANGEIELSDDIIIGEIEYKNIVCLKDVTTPLLDTFKGFSNDIEELRLDLEGTKQIVSDNTTNIEEYKQTTSDALGQLSGRIDLLESSLKTVITTFEEYIKKNTPIIGESAYGQTPYSVIEPQEGQLYFTVKQEGE